MSDRPLLTATSLAEAHKLLNEYNKLMRPHPDWVKPETRVRITAYHPANGWTIISDGRMEELGTFSNIRSKERAAIVKDQLLELGVTVD